MSLNYGFAIDSKLSFDEFMQKCVVLVEGEVEIIAKSSSADFIGESFNGSFSLTDDDKKEVYAEIYGIRPTIRATIRERKDKRVASVSAIFRFLNQVIHGLEGDFIFEFNSDFPVVIRKGGHVQINHEFDDGTHVPFDEIKGPVEIIRMKAT